MLVIVRHGNTFTAGEPPRRIGAHTDLPLTDKGMDQAQRLGAHFAALGWRFSRALVSPLLRTRQTAQAILEYQGDPPAPEPADFLREIDHGPDENMTEDAVITRIGQNALAAWDKQALPPQGWIVDADHRIAAWQAILHNLAAGAAPVLLVTSNGAARFALMADADLQAAAAALPALKLPTGSYGAIKRSGIGALELAEWGKRP